MFSEQQLANARSSAVRVGGSQILVDKLAYLALIDGYSAMQRAGLALMAADDAACESEGELTEAESLEFAERWAELRRVLASTEESET